MGRRRVRSQPAASDLGLSVFPPRLQFPRLQISRLEKVPFRSPSVGTFPDYVSMAGGGGGGKEESLALSKSLKINVTIK